MIRRIVLTPSQATIKGRYQPGDTVIALCDASTGAFTATLPDATTLDDVTVYLKKTDSTANAVTVAGPNSQTIDGNASLSLAVQHDVIGIASDRANFKLLTGDGSGLSTNHRHYQLHNNGLTQIALAADASRNLFAPIALLIGNKYDQTPARPLHVYREDDSADTFYGLRISKFSVGAQSNKAGIEFEIEISAGACGWYPMAKIGTIDYCPTAGGNAAHYEFSDYAVIPGIVLTGSIFFNGASITNPAPNEMALLATSKITISSPNVTLNTQDFGSSEFLGVMVNNADGRLFYRPRGFVCGDIGAEAAGTAAAAVAAHVGLADPHSQYQLESGMGDYVLKSGNITQILIRAHNDLQFIQGGTGGQYNHLTDAQIAALHAAVTVTNSATISLSLTGQALSASVIQSGLDHGSIGGLGDDDHTQYYNQARGDARYSLLAHRHPALYDSTLTNTAISFDASADGTLAGNLTLASTKKITFNTNVAIGYGWGTDTSALLLQNANTGGHIMLETTAQYGQIHISPTGGAGGGLYLNNIQSVTPASFLALKSDNRVGIRTPAEVRGDISAAPLTHGVSAGYIGYADSTTTWTNSPMVVSGGNVGIGCSPTATVDYAVLDIQGRGSDQAAILKFRLAGGTQVGDIGANGSASWFQAVGNRYLEFYTNGVSRMHITGGGNVGVGCTPIVKFEVDGGSDQAYIHNNTSAPNGASTLYLNNAGTGTVLYVGGTGKSFFQGNVGIGGDPITTWASGGAAGLSVASNAAWPAIAAKSYNASGTPRGGMLVLGRSRGAVGANVTTVNTDYLGYISFEGVNGSSNAFGGAAIFSLQTGDAGVSCIPADLVFAVGTALASPAEAMRIASGGNVGIGAAPYGVSNYRTLTINSGANGGLLNFASGSTEWAQFGGNASSAFIVANGDRIVDVYTNSALRMRFTGSGDVVIGSGNAVHTTGWRTLVVNGPTAGMLAFQSNGVEQMRLYAQGGTCTALVPTGHNYEWEIGGEGMIKMTLSTNGDLSMIGDCYTTAFTSYTPVVTAAGGTPPTFATRSGYYKKVGKLVYFWYIIDGDGGVAGANMQVTYLSLPTAANASLVTVAAQIGCGDMFSGITGRTIMLQLVTSTTVKMVRDGSTDILNTDFPSGGRWIRVHGCYEAA